MVRNTRALLWAGLTLGAAAPAALAQATFTRLGVLPAGSPVSSAHKLSRDGRAVVGHCASGGDVVHFRWSAMDGMVPTAQVQAVPWGYQWSSVSQTGRYVVGGAVHPNGIEAYRWSVAGGVEFLGDLPGAPHRSLAFAVSEDGSVVAGGANATYEHPVYLSQPFRWTQATGLVGLGYADPSHDWGEVWAMTPDGSVLVGGSGKYFVEYVGFIWTQSTGVVSLGDVPGGPDTYSPAWDLTPDGQVVVGVCSPPGGYEAYRWTQGTGMVPLGDLPGGDHYSAGYSVSDDGEIIVGVADWDGGLGNEKAMIWDAVHGMRSLQAVLQTEHGLDLTGWKLTVAAGVSGDGTVIAGEGFSPEGHTEAWIVTVPRAGCRADLNGDGMVDFTDYLEFLNLYDLGC